MPAKRDAPDAVTVSHETKPSLGRCICWQKGGWQLQLVVILVAEDDPIIQVIVKDALTQAGFEPAVVASGEEAVTLLEGNRSHYRAVVTDINLRGKLGGWEVAKQAREIDPAFPIVYITGTGADEWASHGVPSSVLLTKPFAPTQLVMAVAQLLNCSTNLSPLNGDSAVAPRLEAVFSQNRNLCNERQIGRHSGGRSPSIHRPHLDASGHQGEADTASYRPGSSPGADQSRSCGDA
jgi:CheY-like chemotaxis protein